MRKTTFISGLGLAIVLGAGVAVSSAQPPAGTRQGAAAADTTHRGRRGPEARDGERGRRGGRGPEGMLLRGITLTDAQKQQVATLRQQQQERMRGARQQFGANRGANRGANGSANGAQRQRPDSATFARMREQFRAERERDEASLRAILTPEQQRQFDANKAEMAKRMEQRQARGGDQRGGDRAQWRGRQG